MSASDLKELENIINKFPLIIPRGTIDVVEEAYTFRDTKDKYFIRKAPVDNVSLVSGELSGASHDFTQGVDYQIIDDDNDGENDTIDWSIGGDSPDDSTVFYIDYKAEAVISRYIRAHDEDVDGMESDINAVIASAQVANAEDEDLDRIGALFGRFGEREGKDTSTYRQLLQSLVQSFKGRGTKPGMKAAIRAGTGIPEDKITITEDTDNTGYEISISSDVETEFIGTVISEMAELSDPSGVKLLDDPVVLFDGRDIGVSDSGTTVSSTSTGLGSNTLTLDGNSTLG